MKPIRFVEANRDYGTDQPEYIPLPAHKSDNDQFGVVTSCWELTFRERLRILFTGLLWFQVMTFNYPPQPLKPETRKPELAA